MVKRASWPLLVPQHLISLVQGILDQKAGRSCWVSYWPLLDQRFLQEQKATVGLTLARTDIMPGERDQRGLEPSIAWHKLEKNDSTLGSERKRYWVSPSPLLSPLPWLVLYRLGYFSALMGQGLAAFCLVEMQIISVLLEGKINHKGYGLWLWEIWVSLGFFFFFFFSLDFKNYWSYPVFFIQLPIKKIKLFKLSFAAVWMSYCFTHRWMDWINSCATFSFIFAQELWCHLFDNGLCIISSDTVSFPALTKYSIPSLPLPGQAGWWDSVSVCSVCVEGGVFNTWSWGHTHTHSEQSI